MPGTKRTAGGSRKPQYAMVRKLTTKSRQALRRKQRNSLVRVPRHKLGFPQSMQATLRYTEVADFVLNDHSAHVATFRANDLYNPRVAGGAPFHQPRTFDQYMILYNTFTVQGSKISVNFMYEGYMGPSTIATDAGSGNPYLIQEVGTPGAGKVPSQPAVMCGVHKGTEQLQAGNPEEQIEKDRTIWRSMTPSGGQTTLSNRVRVSEFFGKDALTGSAGYTGTASNGPDHDIFWEVWAGRGSNQPIVSGDTCNIRAYVTIEYNAVFTDPKTQAES